MSLMPDDPETRIQIVLRVDRALKEDFVELCRRERTNLSQKLRSFMVEEVARHKRAQHAYPSRAAEADRDSQRSR